MYVMEVNTGASIHVTDVHIITFSHNIYHLCIFIKDLTGVVISDTYFYQTRLRICLLHLRLLLQCIEVK